MKHPWKPLFYFIVIVFSSCAVTEHSYYPSHGTGMLQGPDIHPWAPDSGVVWEGWVMGSVNNSFHGQDTDSDSLMGLSDSADFLSRNHYSLAATFGWAAKDYNGSITLGYARGKTKNLINELPYNTYWIRTSNALVIQKSEHNQIEFPLFKMSLYQSTGPAEKYLSSMELGGFRKQYDIGAANTVFGQLWVGSRFVVKKEDVKFNYVLGVGMNSNLSPSLNGGPDAQRHRDFYEFNLGFGLTAKDKVYIDLSLQFSNIQNADVHGRQVNPSIVTTSALSIGVRPFAWSKK